MNKEIRPRLTPEQYDLLQKTLESGDWQGILVDHDRKVKKLSSELKDTKNKYAHLQERNDHLISKLDAYESINTPAPKEINPNDSSHGSESVAFMVLSDLHIEEEIVSHKVNGLNEYDMQIAEKRLMFAFQTFLKQVGIQRHGTKIGRAVLALLGDNISGYIHDELKENNQCSPTQAINSLLDWMIAGIDFLVKKGEFSQIDIPCCVGNHGRTTVKKQISTSVENSFEWLLYKSLERHYSKNKIVNIMVSSNDFLYYDAWDNYKIRFHHGDSIRYGGGVMGIGVPVYRKIAGWNHGKPVNLDVFGHFHQFLDGGTFICNGSLIGYSSYAQFIGAKFEVPKQAFFLIEKDHGKTVVAPILVGEY